MATTSHQMTITTMTVIQCRWIRKQEWMPSILYRPTSMNGATNDQSQILPIRSGRAEGHTRVSLVRCIPTMYQLEKRMDRYYSTSDHIQCTQRHKGKIHTPITKASILSERTILYWMSNHCHTSREPTIENPGRISMTL